MSNTNNKYKLLFAFLPILVTPVSVARAQSEPSFPSCTNPSGSIVASYDNGTHGIVGDLSTYQGSDKVFKINESQWLQCFCPSSGSNGIQTNWWKVQEMTEAEIDSLTVKGWKYVPTGAVWGLEDSSYLAKNITYSCGNTSTNSGNSGSSSSTGGTTITTPSVLGLAAATGTTTKMLALFLIGALSILLGLLKIKKSNNVR